jgi:hypothetical protein
MNQLDSPSRRGPIIVCAAALAALLWAAFAVPAFGYPTWDPASAPVPVDCNQCHASDSVSGTGDWEGSGPHGNYSTTTKKCALCHSVHNAPDAAVALLRGATITATCQMCHDGTGAIGVYKTIEAFEGAGAVQGEHSVEVTNVIPGGSSDLSENLSCGDCHSVHASNTVNPFLRDSGHAYFPDEYTVSNCLLRSDVNGASVAEYGAEWCAACHDERHSTNASAVVNHPVATDADWTYGTIVSTLTGDTWHIENPDYGGSGYATGLGQTNSGYIMEPAASSGDGRIEFADPDNRTYPICQQCHEDARDVEAIFQGDYTHTGDPALTPWLAPVNPEFETFPHQTTNTNMLVEPYDDLCLNCHPVSVLP